MSFSRGRRGEEKKAYGRMEKFTQFHPTQGKRKRERAATHNKHNLLISKKKVTSIPLSPSLSAVKEKGVE